MPPPTTPQSNTLFKYFSRTPKSQVGTPKSSEGTPNNNGSTSQLNSNGNGHHSPPRKASPSTPTTGNNHAKKRRPSGPLSGSDSKRLRGDDQSCTADESVRNESDEEEEPKEIQSMTKKRENTRQTKANTRKRIKVIDSSEDEENFKEVADDSSNDSDSKTLKSTKKTQHTKAKGKGIGRRKSKQESDDEYMPSPEKKAVEESEGSESGESEGEEEVSTPDEDENDESPKKSKLKKVVTSKSFTPASTGKINAVAKLAQFKNSGTPRGSSNATATNSRPSTPLTPSVCSDIVTDRTLSWPHLKLPFLQPHEIKDASRLPPTDPKYNPRTLFIPKDFLDKQTPAMRQWWDIKAQNYDTVLFFKVGKFYEFYHMDAVIANQELRILYMKSGEYAHSGFPEISYSKMASALVEKGYKVARIEQTETPDMMAERLKKIRPTKFDKVVKREICQIATRGVRYASFQDDAISNPFTSDSVFLYAIVERASSNGLSEFGVCFVDTTLGNFFIGQFPDDRHCSRLRTLFSHHTPAQILYERGKLSPSTQQLFNNYTDVRKDSLSPDSEFWGAQKVLKYLAEESFFRDQNSENEIVWPENLKKLLSEGDSLGLTPEDGSELGLKALGGVVWYLKYCLLDHDLLSLKRFFTYLPVDLVDESVVVQNKTNRSKFMVLDGITLRNLDITEGTRSLLSVVDRCVTHFGKRKLRQWVCMPMAIPKDIEERLDAVEELISLSKDLTSKVNPILRTIPDLERLLNKVHYLGSSHRSKNHPEGRAFFFEAVKYSKNKISDLLSILKGFKTCQKIIELFQKNDSEIKSALLSKIISQFPSLGKLLQQFDDAFDHQSAAKLGKIIPRDKVDTDYDSAKAVVAEVQEEANAYLKIVSKRLEARVVYFGSDKKRYQLEVPDYVRVSKDFEMSSSKKGFKRYYDAKTKEFLTKVLQAEAVREEVLRDITRRIFEQFDSHRDIWKQAVECISTLDALLSLSAFSSSHEDMCRPVVKYSDKTFMKIVDGRHPCMSPDSYIPNSCSMGTTKETESQETNSLGTFVLLTGPNMGGKSTLMRQVGLLSVLAHMGCYVPATKCEMSVVDRIFTRLGANDNIGEGESTFFVEMSETSAILKHSTNDSLVLMDELGRGTATYDGTAIAFAVATALAEKGCRSLFSTHYHTLVESIEHQPSVQLGHMACMVENENEEDPTQETITFLYKLVPGACPKSYGFNAARLAGLPDEVIRVAHRKAKEFEANVNKIDLFKTICSKVGQNKFRFEDSKSLSI